MPVTQPRPRPVLPFFGPLSLLPPLGLRCLVHSFPSPRAKSYGAGQGLVKICGLVTHGEGKFPLLSPIL